MSFIIHGFIEIEDLRKCFLILDKDDGKKIKNYLYFKLKKYEQ